LEFFVEVDWSAEIGTGLPIIEVDWPGFVDLRGHAEAVDSIAEACAEPALLSALIALNRAESPAFTCKCEVWQLEPTEIDPDEFGCELIDARAGWASWIDVIARDEAWFASFERHEAWVRDVVSRLRALVIGPGRIELVIRVAIQGLREGFGITLYAAACGADREAAHAAWERILSAAATATMSEVMPYQAATRASSSIG
jgi:hypothetical protein